MRIDFTMKPMEEVVGKRLGWFFLTDSYFHIDLGDIKLFDYTDEVKSHWATLHLEVETYTGPDVDYYLVRLWEDLLEILPNVLCPVPESMAVYLDDPYGFLSRCNDWLDEEPEGVSELWEQVYFPAVTWVGNRKLDTGYLNQGPGIWMWSEDDAVTIYWDNRDKYIDGIPVWTAQHGQHQVSLGEFIKELATFNAELFRQMQLRVDAVEAGWSRSGVTVDLDHLKREQRERARWFVEALQRQPSTDWDAVEAACARIISET